MMSQNIVLRAVGARRCSPASGFEDLFPDEDPGYFAAERDLQLLRRGNEASYRTRS